MIEEIQSLDGFYLKMLSEYRLFKELYDKDSPDERDCFIYNYMKNFLRKKALTVAESKDNLLEYAKNRKKNKYILLDAMEKAREKSLIKDAVFVKLYKELTGDEDFSAYDKKLVKETKHKFLVGCIDDFFINKGFSVKTCEKSEKIKKQSSGYISELDMWGEYCKYTADDIDKEQEQTTLNEELEAKCVDLFKKVTCDNNLCLDYLPLYFDSNNGAGIYIISMASIKMVLSPKDVVKVVKMLGHKKYYLCVTHFYDFCSDDGAPPSNKKGMSSFYIIFCFAVFSAMCTKLLTISGATALCFTSNTKIII